MALLIPLPPNVLPVMMSSLFFTSAFTPLKTAEEGGP